MKLLLTIGVGLRIATIYAQGPGFLGYPDSAGYIGGAQTVLFLDSVRPAGYALFLRLAHALDPSLAFAIALQHGLGLGTAVLLYLTVQRVAPGAWGLLPAAVVVLAGPQLLLEHSPLSEPLFAFLVALLAYCVARALEDGPLPWAYLAGLAGAGAGCVRAVGVLLPVVAALAVAAGTRGGVGRRVHAGAALGLCALLVIGLYISAMRHATDYRGTSLTRTSGWVMYSRAAPFADCERFTPPGGTRGLCESRPVSERPQPPYYQLPGSPAAETFGFEHKTDPAVNAALSSFARTAIVHQPLDYLRAVGTDVTRFWSSDDHYVNHAGQSYEGLTLGLLRHEPLVARVLRQGWYATARATSRPRLVRVLRGYERHTRLEGPLFVLLVLLAFAGVPLARGDRLTLGLLMIGLSAVTLLAPIMSANFDARYAVPGYGPLAAAAAIGAASLWQRVVAWRSGRPTQLI